MRTSGPSRVISLAILCAIGALTGCESHGNYTAQFRDEAQGRMAALKAGTQWDMAQQQFLSGDLAKALKSVDESIAIKNDVPKSHLLRGRILIEMGRLESALDALDRASQLDEGLTDAYYYRGIVFERFNQPERALTEYQKASELDHTNPQYAVAAAEMLVESGKIEEARLLLVNGAADFEHNAGVRQTLGHIAMMEGRIDDAVKLFSEAALLAPDEMGLLEDLARAQVEAKRFADAEFTLRRLLDRSKDTDRRDLKHLLARCLIEIDRPVEARSILDELVSGEYGNSDVRAWIELGNVAVILKDQRRLRDSATRTMAIAPERPEGYFLLATWQKNKGNLSGAIASLDRAIERAGEDSSPALMQAMIYKELGQTDKATRSVKLALHANPRDERAQRLLSQFESGRLTTVPVQE